MRGFRHFAFTQTDTLPRLAWCARIIQGDPEVSVRHGPWLERDEQAFYEGAWSGELSSNGFDSACTFTGSGARITDAGIIFATSTHTLEPIHCLRLPGQLLCSNSMHFLLAEADDAISADYLYYDADMMTIMFGTNRYKPFIPTAKGRIVQQFYHCNFTVSPTLEISRSAKPMPPQFTCFSDYAGFLFDEVAKITRNANDYRRRVRYEPLATLSTGYDSPTCAVLAKAAGCRKALTFTTARSNFADRDDDGTPIAAVLDLEIAHFTPLSRSDRTDFPEVEFIATGHGGDDVVMATAEDALPAKLVYTGYHGDKIWDRHTKNTGPDIVRGDTSGCSLGEFRLRTGFINLPVPFIGCARHAAIQQISNSAEMAPWALNNDYDRPIARRIVEEAGVPRHLFGQSKKAITTPYQSNVGKNPPLEKILCEHSYRDFALFAERLNKYDRLHYRFSYTLMHILYMLNLRAVQSGKLKRALSKAGLPAPRRVVIPWRFSKPRTNNSLAFHWAAAKIRQRYLAASPRP